jgi:hypothetical protein
MNRLRPFEHCGSGFEFHSRHVCLCAFILCVERGLETGWSPVHGVLPIMYRLGNWKCGQGPKGCRAIERERKEDEILSFSFSGHSVYDNLRPIKSAKLTSTSIIAKQPFWAIAFLIRFCQISDHLVFTSLDFPTVFFIQRTVVSLESNPPQVFYLCRPLT